ncbi:hypothetical protein GPROT1_02768 [Gammaproteobacteria bacterium]|nr:hypothetical protein [Sandaracinaceae bacterium]CAG0987897.1 hypothetical protein GPROT1_02768 [Gammaproteobacteria bacterium]
MQIRHLLAAAALLLGCTRSMPSSFPRASAASPDAAEAPRALVARSLLGEPPLPGESTAGWDGLESAPAADPHRGHRHAH